MQNYNDNDVTQFTPETDSPNRVNRQGIVALLGAVALLTPLWYTNWFENPIMAAIVGLSLLITPGLSVDMLVYSGMRRPSVSLIGSTVILGIAWYSGIISLLMTLGYGFDINRVTIITLIVSTFAMLLGLIIGGQKSRKILSKEDLKFAGTFISTVSVMALIASGAYYVSTTKNVFQPTGDIQMMSLNSNESFAQDKPYVAYENNNAINLNVASSNQENELLFSFTTEEGETFIKKHIVKTSEASQQVKLTLPFIKGCGILSVENKTSGQKIDGLYVKAFETTECAPVAYVDIFEKFDIDLSGAPTGSLKELLKFAEEQLNKANMDELPQAYKDCIKKEDVNQILECIDSVK